MKVTSELKSIVKCAFNERKTAYRKRKVEEHNAEYKAALEWVENSEEYKDYVAAYERLKAMLTPDAEVRNKKYNNNQPTAYFYYNFKKLSPTEFIRENYRYPLDNDEELVRIEKEQNALLVKLTYEKDMDRIQELLSTYGIEI